MEARKHARTKRYMSIGTIQKLEKECLLSFPSYTRLQLPYRVICRQRYHNCLKVQHQKILDEIKMHEDLQPKALGGVKLYREFCDPVLKRVSNRDKIKLTEEEERRLEYLLRVDVKDL